MQSSATTPKEYINSLPEDRKQAIEKLRRAILKNLPKGFLEIMTYGMFGYVVPHSMYPDGYHCDPKQPLPFISIASQKNYIALYHMGIYSNEKLLKWFINEFPKHSNVKLDVGKCCIRFKRFEKIPYKLIGELVTKIKPTDWIKLYENNLKK